MRVTPPTLWTMASSRRLSPREEIVACRTDKEWGPVRCRKCFGRGCGGSEQKGSKGMGPILGPGAQTGYQVFRAKRSGRGVPFPEGDLKSGFAIFEPANFFPDWAL